jgi:SAM-dependent methyltransferase
MKEIYTLQVGEQGRTRLNILNSLYNNSTQQFLYKSGLKSGMTVLEIGCGTGEMACWIAKSIAPHGEVVAIDSDEKQLVIASQYADAQGIKNIKYKHMPVYDIATLEFNFDIIFSRWVLAHLVDPWKALTLMYAKLNNKGFLLAEVAQLDSCFCYPYAPALQKWYEVWTAVLLANGKDIQLAYKLPNIFLKLGCKNLNVELYQPVLKTFSEKLIISMNIREASSFILQDNIMTESSLKDLIDSLEKIAYEDNFISFVRNIQICGQKLT